MQGEQLLAARGKLPECLPQGRAPLAVSRSCSAAEVSIVCDGSGGERVPGVGGSVGSALDTGAFAPCGGRQPAGKRGRVAKDVQLVYELQPDVLGGVGGVGVLQPVLRRSAGSGGIPVHQCVPGLLFAVPGPGDQAGDHRVTRLRSACWVRAGFVAMASPDLRPGWSIMAFRCAYRAARRRAVTPRGHRLFGMEADYGVAAVAGVAPASRLGGRTRLVSACRVFVPWLASIRRLVRRTGWV